MSVKHTADVPAEIVSGGSHTRKQVLISAAEGPHFAMRRFVMAPGGGMPRHTNLVEHEQYVLTGRARIGIGDDVYVVQQGDVVFIPAEVPHWYKNIGDDDFTFLCIVPNKDDKTVLLPD